MKAKLTSAQIAIIKCLAVERGRYVKLGAYRVRMKIMDSNFNWIKDFKKSTFACLLKYNILIKKDYESWELNPEIKGWDWVVKHLNIEHNPKVNWYNNTILTPKD